MNVDEKRLREMIQNQSVSQIPEFVAESFDELREMESSRRITIGIDYSGAREVTVAIGGIWEQLMIGILAWVPLLVPLASVGCAIIFRNPSLLWGVLASLVAFPLAIPLSPMRGCMTLLSFVAVAGLIVALTRSASSLAFSLSCALTTVLSVRALYYVSTMGLRLAAKESEVLFIYLFERRICTVRDNTSGEIYASPPS